MGKLPRKQKLLRTTQKHHPCIAPPKAVPAAAEEKITPYSGSRPEESTRELQSITST
jgi:hypothetical protein